MFAPIVTDPPTFTTDDSTTSTVETITVRISADAATVHGALAQYCPGERFLAWVDSLGLLDRLAAGPELLEEPDPCTRVYALAWRLEQPQPEELLTARASSARTAQITWAVRLTRSEAGGTLAAITVRVDGPSDESSRTREAVEAVATISRLLATRLLARVRAVAHDLDELAWEASPR